MRRRIVFLCLVWFSVGGSAWAQQGPEESKFIVAPKDTYLLTIVSQPDCPIQVENARLLLFIGPGSNWGASYRLRNVGSKPLRIHSITLSMWTAQAVGSTWEDLAQDTEKAVLPGETITAAENRKIEVIPLTDQIRNKLKLRGPLKAVVVLMVEQIKFSDGSAYSDEHTAKALRSYFEKIELVDRTAK